MLGQEKERRKKQAWRLFVVPLLLVISVWSFVLNPEAVLKCIPSWVGSSQSVTQALPPLPSTKTMAFQLGQLETALTAKELAKEDYSELMKNASSLLGLDRTLTALELHDMLGRLSLFEDDKGLAARVLGFFTFINLIWMFAIFLFLCAIGPVLYLCCAPLVSVLVKLFTNVVLAILKALKPFYEVFFYSACFAFIVAASRFHSDYAIFIALTGCAGLVPCFVYSAKVHSSGGGDYQLFMCLLNAFLSLAWGPLALHYDSSLIGFAVMVSFHNMVGFSAASRGLCYVVGFQDEHALKRVVVTSAVLLVLFNGLKVFQIPHKMLLPFALGMNVMGNVGLFLGLLINAFSLHASRSREYLLNQAYMIIALVAALWFGSVYNIKSVFNVGCTFATLYIIEKTGEVPAFHSSGGFWVGMLLLAVLLYSIALFLNTHPGFIIAMFEAYV